MASIIYNGNNSTGGVVPVDSNTYTAQQPNCNVANNDITRNPYPQTDSNGNAENIVTGDLTRTGDVFLYWNTKADGSGTIYTGGSTLTFPNQSTNLTLYAQWGVTKGLTGGGATSHYQFYYDESLGGAGGIEPARTNAIIANCEADFSWLQAQFAGVTINQTLPIPTYISAINNTSGSWSASWGPPLWLNPNQGSGAAFARCLMIAEVSEMFMASQGKGWGYSPGVGDNEESCGEGLSLFLTTQFQIAKGLTGIGLINNGAPDRWLNTSLPASNPNSTEYDASGSYGPAGTHYKNRWDYVNSSLPFAGNGPGTGCSILFIYYLYHQLGFTIPAIVAAAPGIASNGYPITGACLRGVYQNLTDDTSDPFPYFASLLAAAYPPNQVSSIANTNTDDPWPIGFLSFVGAKNTWGKDEIGNIIGSNPTGIYTDGFYLAIDGFSLNILGAAKPSAPTVAFGGVTTGLSLKSPNTSAQSTNAKIPQQVLFAYDVTFNKQQLGTFPSSGETPVAVSSSPGITVLGQQFPANTEFFFLAGADPYFTNVIAANTSVPWLSEDLRVFTATPGASPAAQYQYPVPKGSGAPQFIENSTGVGDFDFTGAYNYIQALLKHLNQTYGDPNGTDPFDPNNNLIPQQQSEFTADSSVTPFSTIGGNNYNNYSFAIARVRLIGSQGSSGAASGVKVFFRLWGTQTADTQWDPGYTYLSDDTTGLNPHYPVAPSDNHTIPFFATSPQPNFSDPNDPEFKTGGYTTTGANNLTITINQGDSQWSYFGCFLNVNDSNVKVNNVTMPYAFPGGNHHCLVAEIAYAGAPIQTVGSSTPTPESGSQLAQRNLQVTTTDNPGPIAAHRVPQTFEVRPSAAPPTYGPLADRPDELMIDWGETPPDSIARIYWPAVSSAEVIQLASWMYGAHPLTAADAHTIEVKTLKGVTFVPIPQGSGDWYAGLFSIDMPQTVKTGQEFNILVRRIGKRPVRVSTPPPPPPPIPKIAATRLTAKQRPGGVIHFQQPQDIAPEPADIALLNSAIRELPTYERYIVGSFQIKIPVSTGKAMLPAEETTLAILKARLAVLPKTDRWYPVLLRYIDQIAGRVDGLGGDSNAIPPSIIGYLPPAPIHGPCHEDLQEFTGKVREVLFDCFGDFTGFVLEDCREHRVYESRERQIGDLVLRALRERLTITAVTAGKQHRIVRLVAKG